MATSPTPQSTSAGAGSSTVSNPSLVPHDHTAGTLSRQEPLYNPFNVFANGVEIALYNAATVPGTFTATTVPKVTVTAAVQNVEGDDDNTAGKAQADRFLAEGRITAAEHKQLTTTPEPKGPGVKPSPVKPSEKFSAVTAGISMEMLLTPKGTTLAQMIKNVTFPRTIPQLAECHPSVAGPQAVVNNLAALAQNCIEPIKAKYSNMLITNTYRHGASIGGGQHGTGQACDLQFRGVPAHNYFEIAKWIEQNIPYDQLLLEYLPGKTVWVHMSFALPNLPYGGLSVRKSKPGNILATLNGAAGGKFTPNLHSDIIVASVPNRIVAA